MMTRVECPCCHGERLLALFEEERERKLRREPELVVCCHCEGKGWIEAEVITLDELPAKLAEDE